MAHLFVFTADICIIYHTQRCRKNTTYHKTNLNIIMVVGDGFNLMIIKNKSNFILFSQLTADGVSPTGLFNTDIDMFTNWHYK